MEALEEFSAYLDVNARLDLQAVSVQSILSKC